MILNSGVFAVGRCLGRGVTADVHAVESRANFEFPHCCTLLRGEQFAAKIYPPSNDRSFPGIERIQREFDVCRKLQHEGVVPAYGLFEDRESGRAALIMPIVDGQTFADIIAEEGPIPQSRVIRIALRLTEVLDVVHERGVILRDLKAEHIFLDENDRVRIVDLGGAWDTATPYFQHVGTPAYASPEQLHEYVEEDERTDLRATGILLHELLTGDRIEPGKNWLREFREMRPRDSNPFVTRSMDQLVGRLTRPDRSNRVGSAAELRAALIAIAHEEQLPASPEDDPIANAEREYWVLTLGADQLLSLPKSAEWSVTYGVEAVWGRATSTTLLVHGLVYHVLRSETRKAKVLMRRALAHTNRARFLPQLEALAVRPSRRCTGRLECACVLLIDAPARGAHALMRIADLLPVEETRIASGIMREAAQLLEVSGDTLRASGVWGGLAGILRKAGRTRDAIEADERARAAQRHGRHSLIRDWRVPPAAAKMRRGARSCGIPSRSARSGPLGPDSRRPG